MSAIYANPRPDLSHLLRLVPFGAEGGYSTEGDIIPRVTQTADQVDLNAIWTEMQATLALWNSHRSAVVDVLSYWTTSTADALSQGVNESEFELASEYGEPTSLRPPTQHALLGYDFQDYDRAARFTWKFLRDADARQVQAVHDEALNSDNSLVTKTILRRLFSPAPATNPEGITCYGLWSADGMVPPPFNGLSFDPATHTHYRVTGSSTIDSGDVEEAIKELRSHGYGLVDSNQKLLLLVNETESELVQSWRAGAENANDQVAKWDFIPAVNQPTFVLQGGGQLVGTQPPGEVLGLASVGSYGPVSVIESSFVPTGYFALVATSGPGSATNIVGVRQHTNPTYQGLRMIPGVQPNYPLTDSFYTRSFGVGVRHRGAGICYQLAAPGQYETPEI